jgi:hypothetical protein
LPARWVNHRLPSGPAVMSSGSRPVAASGNSSNEKRAPPGNTVVMTTSPVVVVDCFKVSVMVIVKPAFTSTTTSSEKNSGFLPARSPQATPNTSSENVVAPAVRPPIRMVAPSSEARSKLCFRTLLPCLTVTTAQRASGGAPINCNSTELLASSSNSALQVTAINENTPNNTPNHRLSRMGCDVRLLRSAS